MRIRGLFIKLTVLRRVWKIKKGCGRLKKGVED
jgi:hypothetical protein